MPSAAAERRWSLSNSPQADKGNAVTPKITSSAFIHSSLDEAGLSPSEFRVFCHVARRGECTAAIKKIAEFCRLHEDTVRLILKRLTRSRMLIRTLRSGKTTSYKTAPINTWLPLQENSTPPKLRESLKPQPLPSESKGEHPSETKGDKVNPSEVNPFKGNSRPTLEAVKLLAAKIGLSETEAEKFFNYYESNGWLVGRNPMRSIPHALAGWKLRCDERARPAAEPPKAPPTKF